MVADDKAEEGKSKPKIRPSTAGAQNMQVKANGVAGGTGGGSAGSVATPIGGGATPRPTAAQSPQQAR